MEMPLTIRPVRSRTFSQWLTRTNRWCLWTRRTPGGGEVWGLDVMGGISSSSIRGLGCRGGNHENAAGCEPAVWLLDGHGVGDGPGLYCHAASLNFGYRNISRYGNCPVAVLIAHNKSSSAAVLQDAIGHARARLGDWLRRNGSVRHPAGLGRAGGCIQKDTAFSSTTQFCRKDNDLFCHLGSVRLLL